MKKFTLALGLALVGSMFVSEQVHAQNDMTYTTPVRTFSKYPTPYRSVKAAVFNHFSPQPFYSYSRGGVDAQRMHEWNVNQANSRAWHGQYNYWRWNRPTALVVPPTASFQSSYNWGVGNTRSDPIYHQYGLDQSGGAQGGGGGGFGQTPYYPQSTDQFGVHAVRAPWHH
jgi:hypothetical protein